jgi:hypothetical protein
MAPVAREEIKMSADLSEDDLLDAELTDDGLKLRATGIVCEGAKVELSSRGVKDAQAEGILLLFVLLVEGIRKPDT